MPLVLRENGVAVHIYFTDEWRLIHCFDGDIEAEVAEVEIELDSLLVAGYGPTSKLPTGEFLLRALLLVHKYHTQLLQTMDEISE